MKKYMVFVFVVVTALLASGLAAGAGVSNDLGYVVDIDDESGEQDCEFDGFIELDDAAIRVTMNENWIVATCHVQLDAGDLSGLLGGPFAKAQIYRGFDCYVGTGFPFDDIEATSSHAVLTPQGRLSITCKAPTPDVP